MTSEVIWSNIFNGVIEVIQQHMPISHCPCRRRYYRAIALLFRKLNQSSLTGHPLYIKMCVRYLENAMGSYRSYVFLSTAYMRSYRPHSSAVTRKT